MITATITSPPYGSLKNYGQPQQIGWGQSYDDYLADCGKLLGTLYERTVDEGSLWLITDSLRIPSGLGNLSRLEPLPFTLANEAARTGWILKDVIIWRKDRSTPWSGRGRLRNVFEYILHFVKSNRFKYHVDRIRNPARLEEWWVRFPERYHPLGKVPSNVWDIPIPRQGAWAPNTKARHYCPLPAELIERIILVATDTGDLVFDPFAGIGNVPAHAKRLGRIGLGVEQNREYVRAYDEHIYRSVIDEQPTVSDDDRVALSDYLTRQIITLRILKAPRILFRELRKHEGLTDHPPPLFLIPISEGDYNGTPRGGIWATMRLVVVFEGSQMQMEELHRKLTTIITERSFTTLGIATTLSTISLENFRDTLQGRRLHCYYRGHTWRCQDEFTPDEAIASIGPTDKERDYDSYPPILSDLHINERPRRIG